MIPPKKSVEMMTYLDVHNSDNGKTSNDRLDDAQKGVIKE